MALSFSLTQAVPSPLPCRYSLVEPLPCLAVLLFAYPVPSAQCPVSHCSRLGYTHTKIEAKDRLVLPTSPAASSHPTRINIFSLSSLITSSAF